MLFRQKYLLQTLRRIQSFMDANIALLGSIATGGARTELDAVVAQLTAHGVQQDTSQVQSQGETSKQQALRAALRLGQMKPIAVIAKAQLKAVPGISAMKLPPVRIDAQGLWNAAEAMANAATEFATTFITYGLPTDFVAQLTAAAAAFEASIDARGTVRNQGVGATAGAASQTQRARNAIKLVDSLVAPLIANDAELVAEWDNAKRVALKPGHTIQKSPPTPVTPVAPVTSATPAKPATSATVASATMTTAMIPAAPAAPALEVHTAD